MSAKESSPDDRSPERELKMSNKESEEDTNAGQKRKASSPPPNGEPEQGTATSPKRTKLDDEATKTEAPAQPSNTKEPGAGRRESALQEEKRRGKRLFGGLLNTLSQTASNSQQKRRQEIERRQQARVNQQRTEDDKQRDDRLAKLRLVRKREQIKFDEQVLKTKHANMRAMAGFLQTRTSPKLYYLPWRLTSQQEDTIKDQAHDVEQVIERETRAFQERKEQRLKALGIPGQLPTSEAKGPVGKSHNDRPTDILQSDATNHTTSHTSKAGSSEKEADRTDDVMIEEDEDTVLY